MLAAAMTNRGPMNTGGATTRQNPQKAPEWQRANQAAAQQRYAASSLNQMQAKNAYNQQSGMAAVGGPANGQILQMPATPFAQQAIPAWGGGIAQQNYNALLGAYNQRQSGMAPVAPNNFAFQQQAGMQSAQASMAAQNAMLNMQQARYAAPAPMMPTVFDPGMAAQQAQFGYAAPASQGMTMGGGAFNERGSASTPIGMHLSQLQAPYTSQPMAYGGRAVPASAYMF
jgi:hypothetical protein